MSYVDAQVQDTFAQQLQTTFGSLNIGPKTVGRASGVTSDSRQSATTEGGQSVTPTAAKGGSAFGAESELGVNGKSSAASWMPPGNWLAIAAVVVGLLSIAITLWKRR